MNTLQTPSPLDQALAILSNPESYRPEAIAFAEANGRWPTGREMRQIERKPDIPLN